jgi:nitroreductase
MEQIMDIIKKRRSVRAYEETPLPEGTIDSILEAARYAPSARNLQQLKYKVITNKALMRKISAGISAAVKKEMVSTSPSSGTLNWPQLQDRPDFFYNAPMLIILTGPKDSVWIETDAALAAMNIMLYATSINLGTCFIGMIRFIDKSATLRKGLHISEDQKIAAAVTCGYSDETPPEKEKKIIAEFFK